MIKTATEPGLAALLSQMREEAANEDTTGLRDIDIDAMGRSLWDWITSLEPGTRATRFRPRECADGRLPGGEILETVGPDIPFLVDSLIAECADQGIEVKTLMHPIIDMADGTRLSAIQIHLPTLSESERIRLLHDVEETLSHIDVAVTDHEAMRTRMQAEAYALRSNRHIDDEQREEAIAFLEWLANDHFVFLGSRIYAFETDEAGTLLEAEPLMEDGSNLGVLRDEDLNVLHRKAEPTMVSSAAQAFLDEPFPLIIAKSTLQSRVHRRARADYIGIKKFAPDGRVVGEVRFLGLFTAEAYNDAVARVPLIRRRAKKVLANSGVTSGGHSEKGLRNILETWPRDELFQTHSAQLTPMVVAALHLIARPRTRLLVREDRFGRFVSAFVYVVREAYDSDLRQRIGEMLEHAYQGKIIEFQPRFDGTPLARVHFQIEVEPGTPRPDLSELEARIATQAQRWDDAFRDLLATSELDDRAREGAAAFVGSFSEGYRETFLPDEALNDIREIAALNANAPLRLRAYRSTGDGAEKLRAKIYARGHSIPLSDCVPVLENMGLFVELETGYAVRPKTKPVPDAPSEYWVHDLTLRMRNGSEIDLEQAGPRFEAAFPAIWQGLAENDGFNRLIFTAGLTVRQASLIRALSAYRRQSGLDPTRPTQIAAFSAHPVLTGALVELFELRFDPDRNMDLGARAQAAADLCEEIDGWLQAVSSLDHDRVLRRTADLIMAIQRTDMFQTGLDGAALPQIAFKVASQELADLPAPKPYREIFVSSPRVEGVHLRFGPVARGGLRWSDRRDDFRTEVLGLVKAQQVKNAVIVPVGSKGGFFPKQLPSNGTREEIREEGVAAYKLFISSLLGLTDNLIDGKVQSPARTVVWDGEDPYLVVAADKGTATFSDIANEISVSQGFWLGDAFASGGSAGYDHKKMGITARGGWEAVKRHFREIGKDIQTEPFTVIGVGDMSGDVFGNGMLLSKQIRLQAAFNHLHIFVDPDPQDPERLWEERQRLFDLPRSSWSEYDTSLISEGGGVFDRSAKSIDLSPQIKALTKLKADAVTSDELIRALLAIDVELMWFGGIGTYVKAAGENDDEVGDRANNGIRLTASEVRAKVIGEGANLGVTQRGRIEFAQAGGRINTDAIDNSAGVDSSDHEINIKILLSAAIRRGDLPSGERNTLLASMTDDVAAHVLAHNYAQTGALSLTEARTKESHAALERLMVWLEGRGQLDREVEDLPNTDAMLARQGAGTPLTRPELAVLVAWSKIALFDDLVASDTPDDPAFSETLAAYFPEALRGFGDAMSEHRLKREIIATVLANRLVDTLGPVALLTLRELSGLGSPEIVAAFEAARRCIGLNALLAEIEALDNQVPAPLQIQLHQAIADALVDTTLALARPDADCSQLVAGYEAGFETLQANMAHVSNYDRTRMERKAKAFMRAGAPNELARRVAALSTMTTLPMMIELAERTGVDLVETASTFCKLGSDSRLDRLRASALDALPQCSHWDRVATHRTLRELGRVQSRASEAALANADGPTAWLSAQSDKLHHLVSSMKALAPATEWSFAKFALSVDQVRETLLQPD